MKKEVFLAIAIGIALGLVITFGIWTANKSLASIKTAAPDPTPTVIGEDSTPPSQTTNSNSASVPPSNPNLSISAPEDELLTNQNRVTVSGKTFNDATVVLSYENNKQQVVLSDASGQFSASVDLIAGYNVINITSYDANGTEASEMLTITYSTAQI